MDLSNIDEKITAYLRDENEQKDSSWWDDRTIGEYHVSDATKCPRKAYWNITDRKKPDGDSLRYFKLGHDAEDFIERIIKQMNNNILNSYRFDMKLHPSGIVVKGETDLYEVDENGEIVDIIEIKSTGNLYYSKKEPKEYHVLQLQAYMGLLDVHSAHILYIDRSTYKTCYHDIDFDADIFDDFSKRIFELDKYLREGIVPPKDPQADWECDYCDYKKECDKHE